MIFIDTNMYIHIAVTASSNRNTTQSNAESSYKLIQQG